MTLNVAEVAGRMRAVEESTAKGMRVTVTAAAMKAKVAISAGAPASLGVRYTLSGSETNPSAKLRATGPWQLIEENTSPHTIGPKRRGRARGRRGAVVVPGTGPRAVVHHPGTQGKHSWAKGVDRAAPLVAAEMRKQMTNIAVAAFGG
jgi:hypothetical protein